MEDFDAAGIAVYALSYDEPDALADFRDVHGITYKLLSDPDSEVIRSFGILNTLIDPKDHPWYGIPYPGTYVVDGDGRITHKFFDSNLAVRAGPEQLLRAASGAPVHAPTSPTTHASSEVEVEVAVSLDADALVATVQRDLVVAFDVPDGRHVYADPAPAGSVACEVVLDENPALVQRAWQYPPSELHQLAGTDETFPVYHGAFELRLPLTINSAKRADANAVTISGVVRWQSCDDEVCDIPTSKRFSFVVPVIANPPPALFGRGAKLEPNAQAHFKRMNTRRASS